jgi:hypothetical protein
MHAVSGGALCVGIRCWRRHEKGQARRRVVAGLRLCRACRHGLVTGLEDLPALYDECGHRLTGTEQPLSRTSGGAMPGMPFNATAADVREAILGVLASWSGMVVEERHVTAPPRTASAMAKFMRNHVDWIAGHAAATEITDEVTQLVNSAHHVADPDPVHRVPIGACVEVGCTGELLAFVRPRDPLLPPEISCDADPRHSWAAHEWMQLSRRMRSAPSTTTSTTRWLSAAEISRLWTVPPGSVYRLASEQQWRRHSQARRVYYHEADVLQTFNQRKPQSKGRTL